MKKASSLINKNAPSIYATDNNEKKFELSELKKSKKVIYFYPKDDTPGCTIEAKEFTKDLAKFKKLQTTVIGISGGSSKTKLKFCEKHKLAHTLLSDPEFRTAKKWLSFGKKKFMGREYEGIFRNTFILDEDNNIIQVYESVSPKGHSAEVLEFIKNLES